MPDDKTPDEQANEFAFYVHSQTSLTLLDRVKQLDPEAWSRLVGVYGPLVYDWCRQKGLQSADAADVVQEVFRTVWKNIAKFRRDRPGDSFRGWLWNITRSRVCDHYRSLETRPNALGGSSANMRWREVSHQEPEDFGSPARDNGPLQRALAYIRPEFRDGTWEAFYRAVLALCEYVPCHFLQQDEGARQVCSVPLRWKM